MSYSLEWNPKVRVFLRKLPKSIAQRIIKKILLIKESPFSYLQHFEGEKVYKLRVGDYRALIDVEYSTKILLVQVIDHRKRIYKK